jgi:hypothetical protein
MNFFAMLLALLKSLLGIGETAAKAAERRATEENGAAKAEAETRAAITEIADAQAANNGADRDAVAIGERLRAEGEAGDPG